jgi:KDO2-lipid IV(A) lauroyltransferase
LADKGYGLGWAVIKRMPESLATALFRAIADRTYKRDGRAVQQLRRNLARVVPDPDLESAVHEGMRRYLRYWLEAFRLPSFSPAELSRRFRLVEGEDRLAEALASGRGVICALPHMGNWDLAGAWVNHTHAHLTTVAERLKPESLFDRFVDYRRSLGMEVLALTGEAPPFRTLLERLRAGRFVCLVSDRDLTASGVTVDFFGEPASFPGGPAALAIATGAALFPVTMWVEGGATVGIIHPELVSSKDVPKAQRIEATTQALADVFAAAIAAHPADWHMLQPLWTADVRSRAHLAGAV